MNEDRRTNVRLPADLTVLYENLPGESEQSVDQSLGCRTCSLADISLGGIKMITARRLGAGTMVRIVMMTSSVNQPLELDGKVAWEKDALDGSFSVGVEFNSLSADDEKMLKNLFELL